MTAMNIEMGNICIFSEGHEARQLHLTEANAECSPANILSSWHRGQAATHKPLFDKLAGVDPNPLGLFWQLFCDQSGLPVAMIASFPDYLKKPDKNRVWHFPYFKPGIANDRIQKTLSQALSPFAGRIQWLNRQIWDRSKGEHLKSAFEGLGFSCEEEIWWYEVTPESSENHHLREKIQDGTTFEIVERDHDKFIDELPDEQFKSWASFYKMEGHTPETVVCGAARRDGKVVGMNWVILSDTCTDEMFDGCLDWRKKLGPKGGLFRSTWIDPACRGERVLNRLSELMAETMFEKMGVRKLAAETSSLNKASQKANERYCMRVTDVVRYNMFMRDDSKEAGQHS